MARRKAGAADAPQTRDAAIVALASYRARSADLAALDAQRRSAIAAADQDYAAAAAPIEAEMAALFESLRTFWATSSPLLVDGNRRSAVVADVEIGVRRTPPAVKLKRGLKLGDAITALLDLPGRLGLPFVRVKYELDKEAVAREIATVPDGNIARLGFTLDSKEEFYLTVREPATPSEGHQRGLSDAS